MLTLPGPNLSGFLVSPRVYPKQQACKRHSEKQLATELNGINSSDVALKVDGKELLDIEVNSV